MLSHSLDRVPCDLSHGSMHAIFWGSRGKFASASVLPIQVQCAIEVGRGCVWLGQRLPKVGKSCETAVEGSSLQQSFLPVNAAHRRYNTCQFCSSHAMESPVDRTNG